MTCPPQHPVSASEAEQVTRLLYGVDGRAEPLPGEYDANFRLRARDRTFVLKLMRPGSPRERIELQCAVLGHLDGALPERRLPRVRPTLEGAEIATVDCEDGERRAVWMLDYVAGTLLADATPHAPELLADLGSLLGELDRALASYPDQVPPRDPRWDPAQGEWLSGALEVIADGERRRLVERICRRYERDTVPRLADLRRSVVHADANDYNVVVSPPWPLPRRIEGVIDFGDMLTTCTVCEPAIAAAYAMLGADRPLDAAAAVVGGYHRAHPLTEDEIAVLFDLIAMRLAISVTFSARRKVERPDNEYLTVSETPAWSALERLDAIHPRLAHYSLRGACGLPPVPHQQVVRDWLAAQAADGAGRLLDLDLRTEPFTVLDLGVGSLMTGADPAALGEPELTRTIWGRMAVEQTAVAWGRWDEPRGLYAGEAFALGDHPTAPHRTVHIGIDLFAGPDTVVRAPLDGTVAAVADNDEPYDYGPTVVLEHDADGHRVFTLYGHLERGVLDQLERGQVVRRGDELARIGAPPGNGNWSPHLHFQLLLDDLDLGADFPGVALAAERKVWTSLCPDPNLLLGIPAERFPPSEPTRDQTLAARHARTGGNLSLSYDRPLKIVRGWRQFLYDETGRCYLDIYNNIPHVGHSHPRVVRAAREQMALLNTNTRYLHDGLVRYAERLCALLPAPLEVCFFVNSGSEANELALRLARAATGARGVIVTEGAYHGHTTTLIDISPYKFDGPGGSGRPSWVRTVPIPDDYRGRHKRNDPERGSKYAAALQSAAAELAGDAGVAAFICESLPSVGGQIVLPPGYLRSAYEHVHQAGGITIADEVQVGFGRLGSHFWGFEAQQVVPDVVVMGKPIANGHPMAAVVTSRKIADAFDNGMEFFASFGGNPVSCAAATAVLDVVEQEGLLQHALEVGGLLLERLRELPDRHASVGDVRGAGLFLGVELVRDRDTLEPAAREAGYVVNRLKQEGILCGTDGPLHNVIKIRPPMPFDRDDAELFAATLDRVLGEDPARVG